MSTGKSSKWRFQRTASSASKVQTNITDFVLRNKPPLPLGDIEEANEISKPTAKVLPQKQSSHSCSNAIDRLILDICDDDEDEDFVPFQPRKSTETNNSGDTVVFQETVDLISPVKKQSHEHQELNQIYKFTPDLPNKKNTEDDEVDELPNLTQISRTRRINRLFDCSDTDEDYADDPVHVSESDGIANFERSSEQSICLFENETVNSVYVPETVKLQFDLEIEESMSCDEDKATIADGHKQINESFSPILSRSPEKIPTIESLSFHVADSKIAEIKSNLNVDEFLSEIQSATDVSNFSFRTETSIDKLKLLEYDVMKKICDIVQMAENIDGIGHFCKSTNIVQLQSIRHILMLKQVQLASTNRNTLNRLAGAVPFTSQPLSPVYHSTSPSSSGNLTLNRPETDNRTISSANSTDVLSSPSKKRFRFTPMNSKVISKLQPAASTKPSDDSWIKTDLAMGNSKQTKLLAVPMETQDFVYDSVFDHINLNEIETEYNMNRSKESSFSLEPEFSNSAVKSVPVKSTNVNIQTTLVKSNFQGDHKNDGLDPVLNKFSYAHSEEMMNIFYAVFGLKEFRINQLAAVNAALLKHDCFILMPTGGGKSLCYQLPAIVTSGVTIVISPLRSLIQDQVQKLCSLDIPAAHLSGDISMAQSDRVYEKLFMRGSGIKLLYVTPEKISASGKFLSVLETLYQRSEISRFVIDEVHCVSQWGHDFRPDYKKLHILREKFPKVPLMALTATATPRVRSDILNQLKIPNPKWFLQSFNRTNLRYAVKPKKGKSLSKELIMLIKQKYNRQSGIVYCLSRHECDTVSEEFSKAGLSAISYHAGLNDKDRVASQEKWINDKVKIVCATIAFGMGIDKPDVRFVFHYTLPKSIEGYYQESGRAGRDSLPADCILFYSYQDVLRHRKLIEIDKSEGAFRSRKIHYDNLYRIVAYCENRTDCRRSQQLEYFGEHFDSRLCKNNSQTCDNCLSQGSYVQHDVTQDAIAVVKCAESVLRNPKARFTLIHFIDIFKGSNSQKIISAGHNKLPLHGKGDSYSRTDAERLMRKLVLQQYLQEELVTTASDHTVAYLKMGQRAPDLLSGKDKIFLPMQHAAKNVNVLQTPTSSNSVGTSALQSRCYEELLDECKKIAADNGLYYSNVMNMAALREMSTSLPICEDEMLKIPHVTKANFDKFGHTFLTITSKYATEQPISDMIGIPNLEEDFQSESEESPYFSNTSKPKRKSGWKSYGYKRSRKTKATTSNSQSGATAGKSKWVSRRKSTKSSSKAVRGRKTQTKSSTSNLGAMPFP